MTNSKRHWLRELKKIDEILSAETPAEDIKKLKRKKIILKRRLARLDRVENEKRLRTMTAKIISTPNKKL